MNREEFKSLRDKHYEAIAKINDTKGKDYAGDEDALANFKNIGDDLGLDPMQIWGVYASKHWSAVMTYIREGQVESEPIEGRLHDVILYCFLLLGLIEERKANRNPQWLTPPKLPRAETRDYRSHRRQGRSVGHGSSAPALHPDDEKVIDKLANAGTD